MNYFQWRGKHPEHKPLYYVCGEEIATRLEVLDGCVSQFLARRLVVDAKKGFADVEIAVLAETQQLKVVTINNADKLDDEQKEIIINWAERIAKGQIMQTVLILHSDEVNPQTSLPIYRPFVEKGRFIECKQMTVENMVKYAMEGYNLTESAANLLAEMVSFNFLKFNNELEKLSCLDLQQIDERIVKELVVFSADDVFVNYMLNRNIKMAQMVASAVDAKQRNSVLTLIAKRLSFLYLVIQKDAPGIGAHKLAAMLNVQPWQLLEYFAIKRFWNGPLILNKLKLLTTVEQQYSAYNSNILSLLVNWW